MFGYLNIRFRDCGVDAAFDRVALLVTALNKESDFHVVKVIEVCSGYLNIRFRDCGVDEVFDGVARHL